MTAVWLWTRSDLRRRWMSWVVLGRARRRLDRSRLCGGCRGTTDRPGGPEVRRRVAPSRRRRARQRSGVRRRRSGQGRGLARGDGVLPVHGAVPARGGRTGGGTGATAARRRTPASMLRGARVRTSRAGRLIRPRPTRSRSTNRRATRWTSTSDRPFASRRSHPTPTSRSRRPRQRAADRPGDDRGRDHGRRRQQRARRHRSRVGSTTSTRISSSASSTPSSTFATARPTSTGCEPTSSNVLGHPVNVENADDLFGLRQIRNRVGRRGQRAAAVCGGGR